jgi:hypothetical protein
MAERYSPSESPAMLACGALWLLSRRSERDARVVWHPVEQMSCGQYEPIVVVIVLRIEVTNEQPERPTPSMRVIPKSGYWVDEDPISRPQRTGLRVGERCSTALAYDNRKITEVQGQIAPHLVGNVDDEHHLAVDLAHPYADHAIVIHVLAHECLLDL